MNQSDEESLKRDYCAGVMTLREIGLKYPEHREGRW